MKDIYISSLTKAR